MEPFVKSTTLNEELKNPHLVETLIRVAPSTGKRIESADLDKLHEVLRNKLLGSIPEYDVNFNVQGIPLVLSKQSHVEIRLTPKFNQQFQLLSSYMNIPTAFEYNRALWPKVNAACISQASATFSNFSVESPAPMFLPYLKYNRMDEDLRVNNSRAWNPSYLLPVNGTYNYANRYVNTSGTGVFASPLHRSPYEAQLLLDKVNLQTYSWFGQPLLIQIPLEDLLPVFQIPVLPLRQTNTSNINIRLRLLSPRHMFFCAYYLNPITAAAFIKSGQTISGGVAFNIDTYEEEKITLIDNGQPSEKELKNAVLGGGTLSWLKSLTTHPFAIYESRHAFKVDFDVDCELVLHCLTTPLLNPLAQQYIMPFIDEMNQFVAHFSDYYLFSQTLSLDTARTNARFVFTPSQLFYNTTHVALFFLSDPKADEAALQQQPLPSSLSDPLPIGTFSSIYKHAHFLLRENIVISDFQIMLGSSCTPLFDRPLSMSEMLVATESAMMKYSPTEMFGNLMMTQSRLHEGDAFFLFDLTHARNSGYFIDADNMIRVEGTVSIANALEQKEVTKNLPATIRAAAPVLGVGGPNPTSSAPPTGAISSSASNTQSGTVNVQGRANTPSPTPLQPLKNDNLVHIIMMLIWQNTFTVLFDLDGAVLFQQQ